MNEVIMPRFGDSAEGVSVLSWKVAEGETVIKGDSLCEVETEKAVAEIESYFSGTVLRILRKAGDAAYPGDILAYIGEPGEKPAYEGITEQGAGAVLSETPAVRPRSDTFSTVIEAEGVSTVYSADPIVNAGTDVLALPRTRKVARDLQVDLRRIRPTGSRGEVTEQDVRKASRGF